MSGLQQLGDDWKSFMEKPFPSGVADIVVSGVCPVSIDSDVAGVVSTLLRRGSINDEKREVLRRRLDDFDVIYDALPSHAQSYFADLRQLALIALRLASKPAEAPPDNSTLAAALGMPTRLKGRVLLHVDDDGDVCIATASPPMRFAKAVRLGLQSAPGVLYFVDNVCDVRCRTMPTSLRDKVTHAVERVLPRRRWHLPKPEEHFDVVANVPVEAGWLYWVASGEVRRGKRAKTAPFVIDAESACSLSEEVAFGFVDDDGAVWSLRSDVIERQGRANGM